MVCGKRPGSPPTAPIEEDYALAPYCQCCFGGYSVQTEACHQSNAYTFVWLVQNWKFMVTHAEMHHLNLCLCKLPRLANETEEDRTSWVQQLLHMLKGADVSFCDCCRVSCLAGHGAH